MVGVLNDVPGSAFRVGRTGADICLWSGQVEGMRFGEVSRMESKRRKTHRKTCRRVPLYERSKKCSGRRIMGR